MKLWLLYILLVMGNSFGMDGCICGILIYKVMDRVICDDRKDWTEEEWQKYYEFLAEQEESINELKDNG